MSQSNPSLFAKRGAGAAAPQLTSHDMFRLEALLWQEMTSFHPARGRLIRVLEDIEIVESEALAPDIATIGSLVSYRFGFWEPEERYLMLPALCRADRPHLDVSSALGLAIIGQRAGARVPLVIGEGPRVLVDILSVHFQPEEAARRGTASPR